MNYLRKGENIVLFQEHSPFQNPFKTFSCHYVMTRIQNSSSNCNLKIIINIKLYKKISVSQWTTFITLSFFLKIVLQTKCLM